MIITRRRKVKWSMAHCKLVLTANASDSSTSDYSSSKALSILDTCCIPAFLLKWFKKKSSKKSIDINENEASCIGDKLNMSNATYLISSISLNEASSSTDKQDCKDVLSHSHIDMMNQVINVPLNQSRRPSILVNPSSRKLSLQVNGVNSTCNAFKKRVSFGNVLEQREYHPDSDTESDYDHTHESTSNNSHHHINCHIGKPSNHQASNLDFYE